MLILLLAVLTGPMEGPRVVSLAGQKPAKTNKHEPEPPSEPKADDDFELLPKEAAPAANARELEEKLKLRRAMLQWHQAGGYATLAALTATAVLGQLDYLDKYGGGGDTGRYHAWHKVAAYSATAVFAGTASLAIFAPSPLPKETQLDRTTLHRVAMTVASAGMVTQIALGIVTAGAEGTRAQRTYALAHQIVGYTTVAAAFTGFGVFTF